MPFNIAMKPKNQHIPITKLTYIYLISLPSKQFFNYWINPFFSDPHFNTHDYPPVNNVLPPVRFSYHSIIYQIRVSSFTSNNQNNTEEN